MVSHYFFIIRVSRMLPAPLSDLLRICSGRKYPSCTRSVSKLIPNFGIILSWSGPLRVCYRSWKCSIWEDKSNSLMTGQALTFFSTSSSTLRIWKNWAALWAVIFSMYYQNRSTNWSNVFHYQLTRMRTKKSVEHLPTLSRNWAR